MAQQSDRFWKYGFLVCGLLWVALDVLPGRLLQMDEVFFKSAGLHWAETGQFVAPEIVGRIDVQPGLDKIYFAQPPVYTFLFGLYTRLVGFGPHRCILFDSGIHFFFAFLAALLAMRVFRVPPRYAYLMAILMLPIGTFGRPDELATSFALLGILAWTLNLTALTRAILSGIFFGICGATSVGTCLFLSPLPFLVAYQLKQLSWKTLVASVVVGGVTGIACVSPILITHPDAVNQLLAHAAVQSPEMGAQVDHGASRLSIVLKSYEEGTFFALRYGTSIMLALLGALACTILMLPPKPWTNARSRVEQLVVVLLCMAGVWSLLPGKYTYVWYFAPWVFSLLAATISEQAAKVGALRRTAVTVVMSGCIVLAGGQYARNKLILLTLPPQQSFDFNMARVRQLIPPGARVITKEYWWALADKCQVYESDFSSLKPMDVDYLIKDGNGSGHPGQPAPFKPEYEKQQQLQHFVVIEDDLNRQPLRIAGVPVSRGAYGFGPLVLAKH